MLLERVDEPAALLAAAVDAVASTPPPLGQTVARLRVLAQATAQLHGLYLQAISEADADGTAGEHDCRGMSDVLSGPVGLPVSQARTDAGLADRLSRLPGLLDAVAAGRCRSRRPGWSPGPGPRCPPAAGMPRPPAR